MASNVPKILITGVVAASLSAALVAQGGGTRLDEFGSKLKLDAKTQVPQLRPIFEEGAKAAAPVAQEMLQLRQQMLNQQLTGKTDELAVTKAAYQAAAAKMTGVEVSVFQKVYAMLQPNQQSRTPDAFDYMAGFFQSSGAGGGRGGGRGGGGGGGGRGGGE